MSGNAMSVQPSTSDSNGTEEYTSVTTCCSNHREDVDEIKGTWKFTLRKGKKIMTPIFPSGMSNFKWKAEVCLLSVSKNVLLNVFLVSGCKSSVDGSVTLSVRTGRIEIYRDFWDHTYVQNIPSEIKIKPLINLEGISLTCDFVVHTRQKISSSPNKLSVNMYNDAQRLSQDMLNMYKNKKFCDVCIRAGGQKFQAHQCVLAGRSPVLSAMLESNLTEALYKEIIITDFGGHTVEKFIEYLYTDIVVFENDSFALSMLQISDKYRVEDLNKRSEKFLIQSITNENVTILLLYADMYSAYLLKEKALNFICDKPSILSPDKVAILSKKPEMLCAIMKRIGEKSRKN